MLAKYIKTESILSPEQRKKIQSDISNLQRWQCGIAHQICLLSDKLNDDANASVIHIGEILELDKELLSLDPDGYIVKVLRRTNIVGSRLHSKPIIDYVKKSDLR